MQYYLPHIPPQTPPPSPIYAVWLAMVSRPLTDVTFTTRSSTLHDCLTPSLSEIVMPAFCFARGILQLLLCHRSLIPPCVVLAPTFCKRRGGVVPRRFKGTILVQKDQDRRATGGVAFIVLIIAFSAHSFYAQAPCSLRECDNNVLASNAVVVARDVKQRRKKRKESLPFPAQSTVSRTRPFQTSLEDVPRSILTGHERPKDC